MAQTYDILEIAVKLSALAGELDRLSAMVAADVSAVSCEPLAGEDRDVRQRAFLHWHSTLLNLEAVRANAEHSIVLANTYKRALSLKLESSSPTDAATQLTSTVPKLPFGTKQALRNHGNLRPTRRFRSSGDIEAIVAGTKEIPEADTLDASSAPDPSVERAIEAIVAEVDQPARAVRAKRKTQ